MIPTLHFYEKRGVKITITFEDLTGLTRSTEITSTDVPEFSERPFAIKDGNGTIYDFTLSYSMKSEEGRLWAYYCADHRTVCLVLR